MPPATLSLQESGHVARITLTRPGRGNALDAAVLRDLADACESVRDDDDVRVAILTAEGNVFCSGWDWDALAAAANGGSLLDAARGQGIVPDPFRCLHGLSRPVICAMNGDAHGAGLELALACDIRVAAEGARFSLPETQMGLLPMAGGIQRLARLVGRGRALQLVLTGDEIPAEEAHAIGLVNRIAPRERVFDEAILLAERIAERGPLAIGYAKEAVNRGIDMPLEQALRFETDLTVILQTTEDRAEGVSAFIQKRKPEFKGK
ncbi:MAG TPA: enoyl-CoA hydratase/isomerase family protein [Dehalococcoidia bacterium]|nr:enoyl-CoA hydratase/isomerase family protein [Dehalococcoidia bacterium]